MALLLANVKASLSAMPSSQLRVASSPSSSRMAVTKSWNEALEGATPMRPSHSGCVRSSTLVGSSASSSTRRVVGEHPLAAREADPAAVGRAQARRARGRARPGAACRGGPCWSRKPTEPGDCDRNTSAGVLVALLIDEQRQVGGLAVAHVDVDAGLLGEAIEDRLDQVLRPARVDRDLAGCILSIRRLRSIASAAARHSTLTHDGGGGDPASARHPGTLARPVGPDEVC